MSQIMFNGLNPPTQTAPPSPHSPFTLLELRDISRYLSRAAYSASGKIVFGDFQLSSSSIQHPSLPDFMRVYRLAKDGRKVAIVAFRGSFCLADWITNYRIVKNTCPRRFQIVLPILDKLLKCLCSAGYQVVLTGHSLGGIQAEFHAALYRIQSKYLIQSIAIDSPGCRNLVVQALQASNFDGHLPPTDEPDDWHLAVQHLPNLVNSSSIITGGPLGSTEEDTGGDSVSHNFWDAVALAVASVPLWWKPKGWRFLVIICLIIVIFIAGYCTVKAHELVIDRVNPEYPSFIAAPINMLPGRFHIILFPLAIAIASMVSWHYCPRNFRRQVQESLSRWTVEELDHILCPNISFDIDDIIEHIMTDDLHAETTHAS